MEKINKNTIEYVKLFKSECLDWYGYQPEIKPKKFLFFSWGEQREGFKDVKSNKLVAGYYFITMEDARKDYIVKDAYMGRNVTMLFTKPKVVIRYCSGVEDVTYFKSNELARDFYDKFNFNNEINCISE